MADIAAGKLGLDTRLEGKRYPRDFWQGGRISVKLTDVSGAPANPEVPTKKALMAALASAVPSHPHYQARKAAEAEALASWDKGPAVAGGAAGVPRIAAAAAAPAAGARPGAAAPARKSSKKKGRK